MPGNVPEIEADSCIDCPHCGHRILLREVTWRTKNDFPDATVGEIVCPNCGGNTRVEDAPTR